LRSIKIIISGDEEALNLYKFDGTIKIVNELLSEEE
jgi:hypothetical protein